MPSEKFGGVEIAAHVHARAELRALRPHLSEPPVQMLFLHLERGDAVAQQSADAVGALVHGDGVTDTRELLRRRQPRRPGADDGHGLPAETLGRLRGGVAAGPDLVRDGVLDVLDRHRVGIDGQYAGVLTGRRAQPSGELREVVRRVQPLRRVAPAAAGRVGVPLRDQIPERAAVVTERDAAVHTASRLLGDEGQPRLPGVDLVPVVQPLCHGARRDGPAGDSEEAERIGHAPPPCAHAVHYGLLVSVRLVCAAFSCPSPGEQQHNRAR